MKRANIQTFLAVARLRSFRQSSDFLNTTQSNVSARIAALERDLGVMLFHRTPGSVQLTAAGRDLIPLAQDAIRSMEAFEAAAGAPRLESGTLRLALSETMVAVLLPEFMRAFSDRFPRAGVEITVESTTVQRQQLLDRTVDVAFLMGPVSEYLVSNVPLATLPLLWVVHPDHPIATRGRITLDDLKRHPIMTYARNSRPYAELSSALLAAGVERPRLFASNALHANLAMTRELMGIGTMPAVFADPFIACGDLRAVACDLALSDLEFTASYLTEGGTGLAEEASNLARDIALNLLEGEEATPTRSKKTIENKKNNGLDTITRS
ncbi:MAG: LysR family transcriptional regulator [Alphaproteobacteria bacterium]|nr:LysR family transcriptional regulator [Alphaproteobacteria bacterium]